jgi:hypothetical protein
MNMSYDSSNLTTPDIKWLGVRPSDLDRFNIPEQCRLPMTDEDIRTGRKLVRAPAPPPPAPPALSTCRDSHLPASQPACTRQRSCREPSSACLPLPANLRLPACLPA